MTKIKLFQLRLFRTIRRQICSIDMIDIETFTNIFRLLNHVDRSIIEKYIQGYSIKSIADESEYSKAFVSERIYVFQNELKNEIVHSVPSTVVLSTVMIHESTRGINCFRKT